MSCLEKVIQNSVLQVILIMLRNIVLDKEKILKNNIIGFKQIYIIFL